MLDRELQRKILVALREAYPEFLELSVFELSGNTHFQRNAFYLVEHGLVEPIAQRKDVMGVPSMLLVARVTAAGLDFLEDDGGLSAILGTVTVKIAPDTLQALLEARIEDSTLPAAEKATLKSKVGAFVRKASERAFWTLFEEMLKRSGVVIDVVRGWK